LIDAASEEQLIAAVRQVRSRGGNVDVLMAALQTTVLNREVDAEKAMNAIDALGAGSKLRAASNKRSKAAERELRAQHRECRNRVWPKCSPLKQCYRDFIAMYPYDAANFIDVCSKMAEVYAPRCDVQALVNDCGVLPLPSFDEWRQWTATK
jgi:hypothetical protein